MALHSSLTQLLCCVKELSTLYEVRYMKFIDSKYFKIDGDNVLFTGPYMEMYVPMIYFTKGWVEEVGDNYRIFGLVNIRTFNDPEGKNPNPIRLFNLPVKFMTYPSGYEARKMDLHSLEGPEPVGVLKYYTNDIVCPSYMAKVTTTFKDFLGILTGGKVPPFTSYEEIINIWKKNMTIAGINFDIPDSRYEIVISKIYRSKRNPQNTFGSVLAKDPKHDPTDYVTFSPREITRYDSVFTGMIFEDMDQMITSGINRTVKNKTENRSPMEDVIKF